MSKDGAVGALAISIEILRHNSNNSHGDTNEDVMVNTDPDYVEPCQAGIWCSPTTTLATTTLGEPVYGYYPRLDWMQLAKEILLLMEIRSDEVTHEGEEGCDSQGLIGFTDDLKVDGTPVKP